MNKKEQRMKVAKSWLRMVRDEGDAGTKAEYLREKGFVSKEVKELLEWDRLDQQGQAPLFS